MKTSLALMCGVLMMSSVVFAEDTVETCANGAGVVITGAVTGYKYCKSNQQMNWWNAYAWCDAIGKRLFDLNDCGCSGTTNCNGKCPELLAEASTGRIWTINVYLNSYSGAVTTSNAAVYRFEHNDLRRGNAAYFALCK